ncbi:type II secretion system F family protein [Nocardia huaxiensis]|uniref:type II secretion system F family protein n=1 Tax=Nocardia huaxiensis TaxID=2755382 RepID=UPI001E622898|nr:type II secretion system F family protein [Nocardia huaxiensis]UFS94923.1 type II secretion system F family protein [Nocardia huaxiensis]
MVRLAGVEVGQVEVALVCSALALTVAPESAARRRFARLYDGRKSRKLPIAWVIRAGVGAGLAALFAVGVGPLVAALLVVGTFVVRRRRALREARRTAACGRLLEGLETVIGELRVGAHPSAAAEIAARETGGEVGRVFAVSAARSRLGGSGADALRRPESAVAVELSRIAEAWQVAEQHGLALAELLSAARVDLLGRRRFRDRTHAALAGPRATAAVLAGLPVLGVGLGQVMGAAPMHVLFGSSAGSWLLPLGSSLACAGLLWTDATTERVLR